MEAQGTGALADGPGVLGITDAGAQDGVDGDAELRILGMFGQPLQLEVEHLQAFL